MRLYITQDGTQLGLKSNRFEIRKDGEIRKSIPKGMLESIQIHGGAQVTEKSMEYCLNNNIPIAYFSKGGHYLGRVVPAGNENVFLQKKQLSYAESRSALELAKLVVYAKINNQRAVLRRYARDREIDVTDELHMMKIMQGKAKQSKTLKHLLGAEGLAARQYFTSFGRLLSDKTAFTGRNPRHAKDMTNALLDFGYYLLRNEIHGKLDSNGFNPYFGFMHKLRQGHPALASDLMEEWRPIIIDALVFGLVLRNEIREEDFHVDPETKRLLIPIELKRKIMKKFEERLETEQKYIHQRARGVSYRQAIDYQIRTYARYLMEVADYEPIIIRG